MPAQPYDLISWIRLLLATATTAGYSLRQDDRSATILAEAYPRGVRPLWKRSVDLTAAMSLFGYRGLNLSECTRRSLRERTGLESLHN